MAEDKRSGNIEHAHGQLTQRVDRIVKVLKEKGINVESSLSPQVINQRTAGDADANQALKQEQAATSGPGLSGLDFGGFDVEKLKRPAIIGQFTTEQLKAELTKRAQAGDVNAGPIGSAPSTGSLSANEVMNEDQVGGVATETGDDTTGAVDDDGDATDNQAAADDSEGAAQQQ